ncbi:MAG: hypothetical protein DRJ03_17600 [Chloroflexi bacterium]|nr:MAG: hypothetical protein DRJ03_17600 [Chloroflexota bacterium]
MICNEIIIDAEEVLTRKITIECPLCDNSDDVVGVIDYIRHAMKVHDLSFTLTTNENGDLFIRSDAPMVFSDCYQLLCTRHFKLNALFSIYVTFDNREEVDRFIRMFRGLIRNSSWETECSLDIIEFKSGRGLLRKTHHGVKLSIQLTPEKSIHDFSLPLVEFTTALQMMD